jgi:hypothetical protein
LITAGEIILIRIRLLLLLLLLIWWSIRTVLRRISAEWCILIDGWVKERISTGGFFAVIQILWFWRWIIIGRWFRRLITRRRYILCYRWGYSFLCCPACIWSWARGGFIICIVRSICQNLFIFIYTRIYTRIRIINLFILTH